MYNVEFKFLDVRETRAPVLRSLDSESPCCGLNEWITLIVKIIVVCVTSYYCTRFYHPLLLWSNE